jgi:hypothetical protein
MAQSRGKPGRVGPGRLNASLEGEVAVDVLLAVVLLLLVFVALDLVLPPRPRWVPQALRPDGEWDLWPQVSAPRRTGEDLFTLSFVRHRLDVLAAELEQLDADRSVFARAFRTHAVQAAYDALLDDASRLAAVQTLELDLVPACVWTDPCGWGTSRREELEL